MEPWQSWAVVLVGAGAAYYYYTSKGNIRSRPIRSSAAVEKSNSRSSRQREENRPRGKGDVSSPEPGEGGLASRREAGSSDGASATDRANKRKKAKKPTSQSPVPTMVQPTTSVNEKESEDTDNLQFAKQLAGVRAGTSLQPPVARKKSERRSPANLTPNFSATSSTTGGDADDDSSPTLSPSFGATATGASPSGADVADMLEAPPAGPSVMRITESAQPQRTKSSQQQSTFQTTETKKQRQNRRKAEEKKLQRQEEEKERKLRLEKQLRIAREARGEPAKNGLVSANVPSSSAWISSAGSVAGASDGTIVPNGGPSSNGEIPLLDTFYHDNHSTASSNGLHTSGTSATTAGTAWDRDLPSEEDQIRMLNEQDDSGWNTVSNKKNKRKTTNANSVSGHSTGNESSDRGEPQNVLTGKEGEKANGMATTHEEGFSSQHVPGAADYGPAQSHPNDSDWAVV